MDDTTCCAEMSALTRRGLLRGLTAGGLAMTFGSTVVTMGGAAEASGPRGGTPGQVLVVLSMRGACDGLSLAVPYADPGYYPSRPTTGIPASQLLATDGTFGLHPQLAPLLPLWQKGRLAVVHGAGLPVPNRSHFSAMAEVEDADPGSATRTGWINRLLGAEHATSPLRGIAVGGQMPESVIGPVQTMSYPTLRAAHIAGADPRDRTRARMRSLHAMWDTDPGPAGPAMRTTLGAVESLAPAQAAADHSSRYPYGDLGTALATVAQTIRGGIPVQVVTVDHGSWDFHIEAGGVTGSNATLVAEFAKSLAAFYADLGPDADRVSVVTLSEFGRRVVENASGGTDHGWGNVMFVAGPQVAGGRYYARNWTRLGTLIDSDVPVTIDYRDVLAELVTSITGASIAQVFPGFQPTKVGVVK